jgi:hypothetical protein
VIEIQNLSGDMETLNQFLSTLQAFSTPENMDWPESLYRGLETAIQQLGWNEKSGHMIVLIGDAEPYDSERDLVYDIIRQFAGNENNTLSTLCIKDFRRDAMEYEAKVPEFYKYAAQYGRGEFIHLENSAKLVHNIVKLILKKRAVDIQDLLDKYGKDKKTIL